jgi:microcompartment protein CcmL/EutN
MKGRMTVITIVSWDLVKSSKKQLSLFGATASVTSALTAGAAARER